MLATAIIQLMHYQENCMEIDHIHHIGESLEGLAILRNLMSNPLVKTEFSLVI